MKNLLIATALTASMASASALELSVGAGRDFSNQNRNYGSIALGQTVGQMTVNLGYARSTGQNRFSVGGAYSLFSVGPVNFAPTVEGAYLNNSAVSSGLAMAVGLEASTPLWKNVDVVADYSYQMGQSKVSNFDGSKIGLGVKYKF
jgi:opacity protein-like surface antigen